MRRTILITLTTLLISLALCTMSHIHVTRVVKHARHLRTEAIEAIDVDDAQRAETVLVELAGFLDEEQGWLEVLCEHDDLHEIKAAIIDAQASIEFGITDDFYQAIYRFGESLEHIADVESVRLTNFY
ncbi:MAG: DUF4363 family protein [Aristaeellaceae bacterium]